jgi:hypothetical protein
VLAAIHAPKHNGILGGMNQPTANAIDGGIVMAKVLINAVSDVINIAVNEINILITASDNAVFLVKNLRKKSINAVNNDIKIVTIQGIICYPLNP